MALSSPTPSKPKVPEGLSGIPIDRERAIKTFPWVNFLSLSFPGQTIEDPKVVKLAKDRIKHHLDQAKISYFYIYEKAPDNGKPHLHLVVDHNLSSAVVHQWWVLSLPTYKPREVHQGLSNRQVIDPDTITTTMFGYLTKDHADSAVRSAWKKELAEKYGVGYVWGVGGRSFHHHYSSIRIAMLNAGELPPELEFDSLSGRLHRLNEHLERHQFQMTITELQRIERGETPPGKGPNARSHFFGLMSLFFALGAQPFEKLFGDYLASYDKQPYETGVKQYLAHLTFKPVLKVLALKMSVVIRNERSARWPSFIQDLFLAVAALNVTAYQKFVQPPILAIEAVTDLGLELFKMFDAVYRDYFTYTIETGHGRGETKQQLLCHLTDKSMALGLGDRLFDLFHEFKFPMVIPPKPWKPNEIFSGGYQSNGSKIQIPFCDSFDGELQPSLRYLNGLNGLASKPFTVNYTYLEFCRNSPLSVSDIQAQKDRDFIRAIEAQIGGAAGSAVADAFRRGNVKPSAPDSPLPTYEQYREANLRFSQHCADKIIFEGFGELRNEVKAFLATDYPGDEGFYVYFPCVLDYRGRIYADTNLSYTTTKLSRYALQAPLAVPFVFDRFREYAVKVYFGSADRQAPDRARTHHFDQILGPRMCAFETDSSVYEEADDPYAMVACCLEYRRFRTHLQVFGEELGQGTYRSKFFVSLDFTASGPQILAGGLRNGSLNRSLNIAPLFDRDRPGNVYIALADSFFVALERSPADRERWRLAGFNDPSRYQKSFKADQDLRSIQIKVFLPIFKHRLMAGSYGLRFKTFRDQTSERLRVEGFSISEANEAASLIWFHVKDTAFLGDYLAIVKSITDYVTAAKGRLIYTLPVGGTCTLRHQKMSEPMKISKTRHTLGSLAKLIAAADENKTVDTLSASRGTLPKFPGRTYARHVVTIQKPTGELDQNDLKKSVAANLIHSIDASFVIEFVSRMPSDLSFFAVHDCYYGTTDWVADFYAALQQIYYDLLFGQDCFRALLLSCLPPARHKFLLAQLDKVRSKHPFDPTFLSDRGSGGNALLH